MINEEEMPWPKKDAKVFAEGKNPLTNVDLQWLGTLFEDGDILIAEGFKIVADRAVEALECGDEARHPDMYFFPIAYLYRHYLELSLKILYRDACRCLNCEADAKVLIEHNLHTLWNKTKDVLCKCFPQEQASTLRDVEKVVLQFHRLDPSGQSFRYAKDTKGKPNLANAPRSIGLTELKDIMDAIGNFFNGCDCALSEGT